jgi:hypothetical protein
MDCAIPNPAFCTATMASVPLTTQIEAPTTPHQVKRKSTHASASQQVAKHAVVLYSWNTTGSTCCGGTSRSEPYSEPLSDALALEAPAKLPTRSARP